MLRNTSKKEVMSLSTTSSNVLALTFQDLPLPGLPPFAIACPTYPRELDREKVDRHEKAKSTTDARFYTKGVSYHCYSGESVRVGHAVKRNERTTG